MQLNQEYAKKAEDYHREQMADQKQLVKWAEREIEKAKGMYVESNCQLGFEDFMYDVAMDCIKRMVTIDHVGYTMHTTLGLISSIVDRLPLTPIDNIFRDWEEVPHMVDTFANRRCTSLLKITKDGDKYYTDISRVEVIDADHEYSDESGNPTPLFDPARWLIDKLYPIEFPYHPQTYKVFVDRSSVNENKFIVKGIVVHTGELVMDHNGLYEINNQYQSVKLLSDTVIKRKVIALVSWPSQTKQELFGTAYSDLVKQGAFPIAPLYYIPPGSEMDNKQEANVIDMLKQSIDMADEVLIINNELAMLCEADKKLAAYAKTQSKEVKYLNPLEEE